MLLVEIVVLNGVLREILGAFIDLFGLSGDTWEEPFEEGLIFVIIISLLSLRVDVFVLGDDLVEVVWTGACRPLTAELLIKEAFSLVVEWCDTEESAKVGVETSLPLVELRDFLF